jgi:plastocyanin
MSTTATLRRLVIFGLTLAATASGGSSSSGTPTSPTLSTAVQATTITITSAGVSPNNIEVPQGARVLFVNNDTKAHNMVSDPHPEHNDCPPINSVGLLAPGRSVETSNLTVVRSCGFHDHDDTNPKWAGRITIK